jgi:hypothetical protein
MSSSQDLDFDFDFDNQQPQSKDFTFMAKKYRLSEASASAGKELKSNALRNSELTFNDDDTRTLRRMDHGASLEILLVSNCIKAEDSKNPGVYNQAVSKETIGTWPNKVVKTCYDWIREVSSLEEKEDATTVQAAIDKLQKKLERYKRKESASKNSLDSGETASV